MATWGEFATECPEFAARVRERFDSGTNKTIATLRRDGSPRISGTEMVITDEGPSIGMMTGRKVDDVRRDPRFAIHSPTLEPPTENWAAWPGEAKMSGLLVEVDAPTDAEEGIYFTFDIREVVHTKVAASGDKLEIESWHPGRGYERRLR